MMMVMIMIMVKMVSLYLIARASGQHLKPCWAAELSLMTSRI